MASTKISLPGEMVARIDAAAARRATDRAGLVGAALDSLEGVRPTHRSPAGRKPWAPDPRQEALNKGRQK